MAKGPSRKVDLKNPFPDHRLRLQDRFLPHPYRQEQKVSTEIRRAMRRRIWQTFDPLKGSRHPSSTSVLTGNVSTMWAWGEHLGGGGIRLESVAVNKVDCHP